MTGLGLVFPPLSTTISFPAYFTHLLTHAPLHASLTTTFPTSLPAHTCLYTSPPIHSCCLSFSTSACLTSSRPPFCHHACLLPAFASLHPSHHMPSRTSSLPSTYLYLPPFLPSLYYLFLFTSPACMQRFLLTLPTYLPACTSALHHCPLTFLLIAAGWRMACRQHVAMLGCSVLAKLIFCWRAAWRDFNAR